MVPEVVFEERFEALRKSASGAMGTVFRARDRRAGGWVAVKILCEEDAHDVERFAREGAILAGLGHPGIVRYVAHGVTAAGEHYLAMEWLDGEDLAARFMRRGLTGAETLTLARRVADALAFAHARGLVHRDLKPSNLFLVGSDVERVKIVDFGIARLGREAKRLTHTGALLGTPGYIAPEQIQGAPWHDPRADVFSLGCVIFEGLAGRAAFEATNAMALLAKILLQEVPRVRALRPSIPEALDDLVARMMARDPAARPADAAAVREELDQLDGLDVVRGLGVPAAGLSQPPLPSKPPSLTLSEHRLVTLVLSGDPEFGEEVVRALRPGLLALRAALEPLGGRVHTLVGGSLLVTQWGAGSAVDRAERAARCALMMKERFAGLPVCVISGRGEVSAQVVDGELIERAVRSLGSGRTEGVFIDEATAELVRGRIRVDKQGVGSWIRPERAGLDGVPLLLGRPTPCVGRARELSMLEGIFSGSVSEPAASAVLVVGEAGSGKTRLRRELLESIRRQSGRAEVLVGACEGLGAGSAFGIIADVLRRAARLVDGEPLAARQAKLRARVGRHLDRGSAARAAAFLGEIAGAPFPDGGDGALRAARESARLMGDGMRAAWEDWLAAECAAQPVLVVLDNLQWSDAASLRLVDSTLRNLRDLPLMFLGLGRPEIHDRFPDLWAERDAQLLKLGPLSRRASEQLVRAGLGAEADAGLVARVVDRADGNPFYLEELVRAVAAGRDEVLPDSVLGTVEARLDAEGAEAKRMLRAASVFGRRFTRDGVALLAGRPAAEVSAGLDALTAHEIVAPASAPEGTADPAYVFSHALLREAAYATLTGADRALGHLLAGEHLERSGHGDAMTLAEHFQRGAEPARAAHWFRRAAELALEADDLTVAVERALLGVDSGAVGEELGHLRLIQAEAELWRGALGSSEASAVGATALLPVGSAAWFRAVRQSVIAAGKLGGYDRVEERMALAARTAPARGAASGQLVCLCECAVNLVLAGRYVAADAMIARLHKVAPDPSVFEAPVAAALEQLAAHRALFGGDTGAGLERFEAALASLESAGDRRNACNVRMSQGVTFAYLGDFESAEEALRSTLVEAERMGLIELAAAAAQNLGRALAHLGRLGEAEQLVERSAGVFQRNGDLRMAGCSRSYLAEIALLAGDPTRAEREAAAAAELLEGVPPLRASALSLQARALLRQGRAAEAWPLAQAAKAILDALGVLEEGEALVRLVHAEVLAATGDREGFVEAARAAREKLLARASRISDTAWRERFLTAVPDNARTLTIGAGAPQRKVRAR